MKTIIILATLLFGAMQLVRPPRNTEPTPTAGHNLLSAPGMSAEVRGILQTACADCHSNNTRYPWYAEIQPAGWLLAKHVNEGKRYLNFSEFGKLTPSRARQAYEAIIDEVESGRMPPKSYTWAHSDARLTPAQAERLITWAEERRRAEGGKGGRAED